MYVDKDNRKLYSIQDLTLAELQALRNAIGCAHLPDKRVLDRLKRHLATLPD